jgi:hypothetical protein
MISRIEIYFAVPVQMTEEENRRLGELLDELVRRPENTPEGAVHWLSFQGRKMVVSEADAAMLQSPAVVVDSSIRNGEEPRSQDDVVVYESSVRPLRGEETNRQGMAYADPSTYALEAFGKPAVAVEDPVVACRAALSELLVHNEEEDLYSVLGLGTASFGEEQELSERQDRLVRRAFGVEEKGARP